MVAALTCVSVTAECFGPIGCVSDMLKDSSRYLSLESGFCCHELAAMSAKNEICPHLP